MFFPYVFSYILIIVFLNFSMLDSLAFVFFVRDFYIYILDLFAYHQYLLFALEILSLYYFFILNTFLLLCLFLSEHYLLCLFSLVFLLIVC